MNQSNPVLGALKNKDFKDQVKENLEKFGYAFVGVNNVDEDHPQPAYVYTVGLHQRDMPDIFVSGNLPQETAMRLINYVIEFWERKKEIKLGRINNFLLAADGHTKYPIGLKEVNVESAIKSHMTELEERFPNVQHRIVQLLWADTKGFLPTNDQYTEEPVEQQHLLDWVE